jgi:hypothetical protein
MAVQSQPREIVPRDPVSKKPSQKRASGVAQGIGPEFKPSTTKKKRITEMLQLPKKSS